MTTFAVRIFEIRDIAVGVKLLRLSGMEGQPLPPWTPGAHIDVHLGELIRQYSLCGEATSSDCYEIAVKREPASRGGSLLLHDEISVGDILRIGAPRNHFALARHARRHLLLAGGIGITPILSMARHLADSGTSFNLHYFATDAARAAFHEEIAAARLAPSSALHLGFGPQDTMTLLAKILSSRSEGHHVYVCGPLPFMDAVQQIASTNWPADALHMERFSPTVQPKSADGSFVVRLSRSGQTVAVRSDQSIVQALADHGVFIDTSCEQGVCGTCVTQVLRGQPDHRDDVLQPAERAAGNCIVTCVSRSHSPELELDL